MSIIIKGLDIPKEYSVIIEIDEYGEICEHVKGDQVIHIKPWAKAIQIPKNHGRLIDMDDSMIFHGFDEEYFEECKRKIFKGHGILEAEE